MTAADTHDRFHVGAGPRVFISYAHDGERHKDDVLELARFLTTRGIRVELDMWNTATRRDWLAWGNRPHHRRRLRARHRLSSVPAGR
jgi:hypothetical protein